MCRRQALSIVQSNSSVLWARSTQVAIDAQLEAWEASATLIESLTAQLATQAEVSRQMREALEACSPTLTFEACRKIDAALALPPTASEQRAAEWKEKAELLDWLGQVETIESLFGTEMAGRTLQNHADGSWSCGNNSLGGWFKGATPLEAIRAAKKEAASESK
jgi:hypothetical protein